MQASQWAEALKDLEGLDQKPGLTAYDKTHINDFRGYCYVKLNKLKEAGYIDVSKSFKDNYPQTICKITPVGVTAFEEYVRDLQSYLNIKK